MVKTVSLPLEGGCQCGALRYRISAAPLMLYACHCSNCQKISGSAFGLSATIIENQFAFSAGDPAEARWVSDAGNNRFGYFCSECGCRIAHGQTPTIGVLSLRAGTLDDRSWIAPFGHIWTRSAQNWMVFDKTLPECDVQPTDYAPFAEALRDAIIFEGQ
ncbi:MAG: GFA family protein [Pseudomonadota bacterium]